VFNQKGIAHIALIFILLVGIVTGVYLVQKKGFQIFKPKAATENIVVNPADGNDEKGNRCEVKDVGGKKQTNCPTVNLQLTSPLDINKSSDAGPNISLVKTAYANHQGGTEDYYCENDDTEVWHSKANWWPFYGHERWDDCIGKKQVCVWLDEDKRGISPVNGKVMKNDAECVNKPICQGGRLISTDSRGGVHDFGSCGGPAKQPPAKEKEAPPAANKCEDRFYVEFPNLPLSSNSKVKIVNKTDSPIASGRQIAAEFQAFHCKNAGLAYCSDDADQDHKSDMTLVSHHPFTLTAPAKGDNGQEIALNDIAGMSAEELLKKLPVQCGTIQVDVGVNFKEQVCSDNFGVIGTKVYNLGRTCGQAAPAVSPGGPGAVQPAGGTVSPAAPSSVSCSKTCTYSQGGKCYRGNCTDGSTTCSNNDRCGYVSACSGSGNEEPCPPAQGGAQPQPPATVNNRTTKYYKIGLSPAEALGAPQVPYTGSGMKVSLSLKSGANYIYAVFVDDAGGIIPVGDAKEQWAQVQVDYNPPSQATPAPAKQADNTNQALTVGDLILNPATVRKQANNSYPQVQITALAASRPWTLYFNNKLGANCGSSCTLDGWTPIIENVDPPNATKSWTPPAYLKGTYTLGIIDLTNYRVVKTANLTLEDQSGATTSSGAKVSSVSVSKDGSGNFKPLVVEVTAPAGQSWTVYYNEEACGNSCNPAVGWTKIGTGTGTGSMNSWTPPSFVSGQHAIAIIDTDANKIIDVRNANFSVQPRGESNNSE